MTLEEIEDQNSEVSEMTNDEFYKRHGIKRKKSNFNFSEWIEEKLEKEYQENKIKARIKEHERAIYKYN